MRVFVTGGTGFIGRALVPRLQRDGHAVVVWARDPSRARDLLGADVDIADAAGGSAAMIHALGGCDGVVNLAGAPIAGNRWTPKRRALLDESRVRFTESLVRAMASAAIRPRVLVSGSAVGFYGDRGGEILTEESPHGSGFLADLCVRWESAARSAADLGTRVVLLRTGVVLGRAGGALASMLLPFRAGVGGPIGSGRQFFPWIHLHDFVNVVATALGDDRYRGAVNAVAPNETTNREFSAALARALRRPSAVRVPARLLTAVFGEAAVVLLGSQRVAPRELLRRGFSWDFPSLEKALDDVVHDRTAAIVNAAPADEADGVGYELRSSATINAPLDETFAFFSKAQNLGLLTPATMKFSIQGAVPRLKAGSTIDYRIALGPVPVSWRTRIAEWEPGRTFVDVQDAGPYKLWRHRHTFRGEGARTVMEDRVCYTPPFGPLGRIVNRFFIAPALRRIFQYRSDVIRLRFG